MLRQERCRHARPQKFEEMPSRRVRPIEERLVIPAVLSVPAIDLFLFVAHAAALANN
jgi:hypothetical protein